ncbi:HHL054Cp [Eremothecium sinecaudum]|uniref:Replication factor C subunit 1 n=1 Tax=Eremothecium sinecaudum TaxID=45286 RepID=A0A0X8HWD0_9SACH|nr:HHL054Cp [Eremothecium sinecaudum]AMD22716.1 HHL054Cp [Eremothecium sinecaudum]
MVDVREFFKPSNDSKGQKRSIKGKSTPKKAVSKVKAVQEEPIDLDLDDDELDKILTNESKSSSQVHDVSSEKSILAERKKDLDDAKPMRDENPLKPEFKSSAPKVVRAKKSVEKTDFEPTTASIGKKEHLTAEEVLAKIPSIDLDKVHVKENVTFNFGGGGESSGLVREDASEEFAKGAPNCLLGLTVVFTGVLPTLDRPNAEALAKRYGARVTKSISGKTSVVVLGDEAGPKKLEKIKQLGVKAIDEEGFKLLISGMPAEGGDGAAAEKARQKLKEQEEEVQREVEKLANQEKERKPKVSQNAEHSNPRPEVREQDKLWTVKYAPTSLQQICGNKAAVTKLKNWLQNWEEHKKMGFKISGRDGSGIYRAAMLSGPPGIGKTTAAHLVAKELGYDILEQNASDVRSKSLLNNGVKNALDNTSVVGFFKSKDEITGTNGRKFVIIMDEVDGMSGGDRGGVGQMAQFCRKTLSPLILICNERSLPKMRPFDKVVCDIHFRRPDAQAMKARLMTIAVREGFKLDPTIIDQLVAATRGDIRQIINLLSTISKTTKSISHENASQISAAWKKNVALKPYDITQKMFEGRNYTEAGCEQFPLYKKMELYFDDIDFTPLMIHENYLNTRPSNLGGISHLQAVVEAADSISEADLVEKKIRSSEQLWSLLPFHAVMSSVRPASKVAGQMAGRINFTSWLGQNSKTGKYYRLLQELHYHTRLSTSASKFSFRMNYMSCLKRRLLNPLVEEGTSGIPKIISVMDSYYLSKEDWDTIMDFLVGHEKTEAVLKKIPAGDKRAFTTMYNKTTHPVAINKTGLSTPYGGNATKAVPDFEDVVDADDDLPSAEPEDAKDEDADLKKDKLIKEKKPRAPTKKRSTGAAPKTPSKKRKTTSK